MTIPFIEENDQTAARREHLEKLRRLVGNVYPNKFERTRATGGEDTISRLREFGLRIKEKYFKEGEQPAPETKDAANAELNQYRVRTSGRLAVPPRVMGKAAFVHLSDGKERLQIYVRKDDAKAISNDNYQLIETENSGWELFNLLDHGDFVGVEGFLFVTKTGELSIHVETIQFLAKAMLPMPDKMHGIADPELQRRYRYADLIASSLQIEHEGLTTREVFERRAKLISGMRRYLDEHGYIEVETPILTPKATGAAAEPFETYHNALDIKLYARIAPELYLKRLMVGGFEKVYELNRNFRNEGLSHKHSPEFTMLEFYCAYMDVNGMMDFAEEMIKDVVMKANDGSLLVKYGENEIDFSKFERLTMKQAISKNWNPVFNSRKFKDDTEVEVETFNEAMLDNAEKLDYFARFFKTLSNVRGSAEEGFWDNSEKLSEDCSRARYFTYQGSLSKEGENIDEESVKARNLEFIFEFVAEENLIQPTFIIDYPKSISPLSKASPENPQIAERFELFINGAERANGFSELNDPAEQYERFVDQMKEREGGDAEAMVLDEDYIRALSYGMPPAAGIGIGIDRLVMLLTNRHSIRDVILFPHMRPERKAEEQENNTQEQEQ